MGDTDLIIRFYLNATHRPGKQAYEQWHQAILPAGKVAVFGVKEQNGDSSSICISE
jgi:hypothetical protein